MSWSNWQSDRARRTERRLHASASVVVKQALMFSQLGQQPVRTVVARHMQLGSGRQRFLVKQIDSRPDFDHIVAIRSRAVAPRGALVLVKTALARAQLRGTVYFSTADLK